MGKNDMFSRQCSSRLQFTERICSTSEGFAWLSLTQWNQTPGYIAYLWYSRSQRQVRSFQRETHWNLALWAGNMNQYCQWCERCGTILGHSIGIKITALCVFLHQRIHIWIMDIIPINPNITQKQACNRTWGNYNRCLPRPDRNPSAGNNNRRSVSHITAAKQNHLPPRKALCMKWWGRNTPKLRQGWL